MMSGSLADIITAITASNSLTTTMINIIWGGLLFFRIIAIIRTAKDSYARTRSVIKQFGYIVMVTTTGPLIGVPLYLALRPARYRTHEQSSHSDADRVTCLHCGQYNHTHHTHCVFCGEKIHTQCRECDHMYAGSYAYCPDCGAPNVDQLVKT